SALVDKIANAQHHGLAVEDVLALCSQLAQGVREARVS
ncbi:MAG: tryptophan synthase subunit alpha, partial [Proteobacteria bacterium]